MIEPTDNEIIMYVSLLQAVQEEAADKDLRDRIVLKLGTILAKYTKLRRGAKAQLVTKFKKNVQIAEERTREEQKEQRSPDLNSKQYTVDTRTD